MPYIKVGERVPSVDLYEETPENTKNIADLVREKRAIIFGVPGAFVPGCAKVHLGGFVDKSEELKSKGYEEIICISVNDPYVLSAWKWWKGADGKVRILADPTARYTNAIRMGVARPELGGVRSRRYSMITDDGVIKELYVEDANAENSCLQHSSAVSSPFFRYLRLAAMCFEVKDPLAEGRKWQSAKDKQNNPNFSSSRIFYGVCIGITGLSYTRIQRWKFDSS